MIWKNNPKKGILKPATVCPKQCTDLYHCTTKNKICFTRKGNCPKVHCVINT